MVGGGGEDGGEPDALHAQAGLGEHIAVVQVVKAVDDAPDKPRNTLSLKRNACFIECDFTDVFAFANIIAVHCLNQ